MLWWYWVILGTILLVADIALINIYYLIWFGVGALAVGAVLFAVPDLPLAAQIVLFGVISGGFLLGWLAAVRHRAAQPLPSAVCEELIGSRGAVVRFGNGRGSLRLQKPIGGRDVWTFTSEDAAVRDGDTVVISAISKDNILQAQLQSNTGA